MKMPAYKEKAAICLASGDTEEDTAQQVNVDVSIIHKWLGEDDFNAYLNSLKRELKPEPERTVLKWTECIYGSRDTSSFPNHCENVLAIDCLGNYAVCCFDAGSRDFFLSHNDDEYFTEVVYWMLLPSQPSGIKPMQNNEYLIEQTTLETFDIIDAITPALREAVKHLLVQQGVSK
jgi:hypothetical protein